MPAPTYLPGPTPSTVRTPSGQTLQIPTGWELLPPGDAALTRRVKAAGDFWLVQEKVGRRVFLRGIWAPRKSNVVCAPRHEAALWGYCLRGASVGRQRLRKFLGVGPQLGYQYRGVSDTPDRMDFLRTQVQYVTGPHFERAAIVLESDLTFNALDRDFTGSLVWRDQLASRNHESDQFEPVGPQQSRGSG